MLGQREEAREYYEKALAVATKIRHRPEIALTRLQMAELCLQEAQDVGTSRDLSLPGQTEALRREARDHLDFGIPKFRDMKMRPALERALRLRESIGG